MWPDAVPASRKRRFGNVWASDRREPPVGEREGARQRASRRGGRRRSSSPSRRGRCRLTNPSLLLPSIDGRATRSRSCSAPRSSWHVLGMWKAVTGLPVGVRVAVGRVAVGVEREPVAAAEHPEVVVEGVVLHHEHDDVLDLGERVLPLREMRAGAGPGADRRRTGSRHAAEARGHERAAEAEHRGGLEDVATRDLSAPPRFARRTGVLHAATLRIPRATGTRRPWCAARGSGLSA